MTGRILTEDSELFGVWKLTERAPLIAAHPVVDYAQPFEILADTDLYFIW